MRESIGATWIFGIVIFFVVLFTGYLAFSINFAKAFTLKDEIVDELEKLNGPGKTSGGNKSSSALVDINNYIKKVNYGSKGNCYKIAKYIYSGEKDNAISPHVMGVTNGKGYVWKNTSSDFPKTNYQYCIFRENQTSTGGSSPTANLSFSTYRVIVFFSVNLSIISVFGNYYVTGDTKSITYPTDGFLS